ncbi:MAG: tRNA lysidine(34) synthetase TilS [Xanthobacteraceae bacterium]
MFADLAAAPALLLAISGGPDSTALLVLAAAWRAKRKRGPKLLAVTVDHGLRPESAEEAKQVARLARRLGVAHRTIRWRGKKPKTRLQEKAREMRYRLLAQAAEKIGASHLLTAHTLDDQAETVLMRLVRGSGLAGLGGMAREVPLPVNGEREIMLFRPFLDAPKARLVATLRAAGIPFAEDPSNIDPRFTRVRMRALLPALAKEGLGAQRTALLARRMRRADAALAAAVDKAAAELSLRPWSDTAAVELDARGFAALPAEVALRLLGRAVARLGDEGPVELSKLEALYAALAGKRPRHVRFRRTLAGAMVTLTADRVVVERAPARRRASSLLTKRRQGRHNGGKMR